MTFGQFVSSRDDHSLDDDVKLFFGLSNEVFEQAQFYINGGIGTEPLEDF